VLVKASDSDGQLFAEARVQGHWRDLRRESDDGEIGMLNGGGKWDSIISPFSRIAEVN
jgi:hypothetical protein